MSQPPAYDSTMSTSLKPYLELPYLLSLAWIAYPILSLVFVIFRLQSSADSAQISVDSAKANFLASCKAAEGAASSTASFPRYMALAANQQFTDAVNGTLNGARDALVLSLTAMEAIINFLVDIYRSTFLCFLELIIRGTLSVLISAVQEISGFVQNTLSSLKSSIQSDVDSINSAIKSLVDGVNKVNPFSKIDAPQFSVPSLSGLDNVQLPSDFTQALIKLNSSIPSAAEIKDKLNAILDTPFELTKKEITETFNNISFKQSVLAVPQQSTITFCDQVDTSVIDDLGHDIIKMTKIATIVITVIIFLLILANCALEWYKWRCLQNHLEYIRQAWTTDPTIYHYPTTGSPPVISLTNHNLLTLHGITAHPLLMRIANQMSSLLHLSHSKHIHIQWFFSYVFHPPALACFLIGFVGLICVQIQLFALGPIAESYRNKALSSAGNFSDTIATAMNQNMLNQSSAYVTQVNSQVDGIQNTINDGVFGWVNSTTSTLNTTLNNFYGEVQDLVQTVFGGTPLEQPMQDFVFCLVGSKVDALTSALTFMHDNLHVNMPQMNQSSLILSPEDVNDAARPIALAAIGSGNGDGEDGGIVGKIVTNYVKSLEKERIMFLIFIGVWGFVVLIALLVIFWNSYIRPLVESRKRRKWQKEQREGFDQFTVPGAHIRVTDESSIENGGRRGINLPSFTPLASPRRPGFFGSLTSPHNRVGSPKSSNGFLKPHPPGNQEKSWDSLNDSSKENEKGNLPAAKSTVQFKSTTRGFLGMNFFGRKTVAKEKFVIDVDDEPVSTGNSAPVSQSFYSRLAALNPFGRKQEDPERHPDSPSPPGYRSPPNLSIDTGRPANLEPANPPVIESSSPTDRDLNELALKSTWSVSPTTPRFPWLPNGRGSRGSLDSTLRVRNVTPDPAASDNVQQVGAERRTVIVDGPFHPPGLSSTRSKKQAPTSPPPFSQYRTPAVSTETDRNPSRPSAPPRKAVPKYSMNDANQGSQVDPFATPFDDPSAAASQRIPPHRNPSPGPARESPFSNAAEVWRSSTNGSPFVTVAI